MSGEDEIENSTTVNSGKEENNDRPGEQSSSSGSNSQPPTPPPPYIDEYYPREEVKSSREKLEEKVDGAVNSTTHNFTAMENSEKDPMLREHAFSVESDEISMKVERQKLVYRVSQSPPVSLLLFFSIQVYQYLYSITFFNLSLIVYHNTSIRCIHVSLFAISLFQYSGISVLI